jgi:hypothetical protein
MIYVPRVFVFNNSFFFFSTTSGFVKKIPLNFTNNQKIKNSKHVKKNEQRAVHTATSRLSYFTRCGKLNKIESCFEKLFKQRARLHKKEKKARPAVYFPSFFYKTTPFIRLKVRRRVGRRKNQKQKLSYRSRISGERQGFLLFSKTFKTRANSAKRNSFQAKFQSQIDSLNQISRRRPIKKFRGISQSASTSTTKSIRDVRDEIHRRAFKIKPRF